MKSKPVDLAAVQQALADIRQVLADCPEVRERTAAFLASDPDEQTLSELQEATTMTQNPLTLRIPEGMLERLDALVPVIASAPELATVATVKRSDVIRVCLLRGLAVLESEYPAKPKAKK